MRREGWIKFFSKNSKEINKTTKKINFLKAEIKNYYKQENFTEKNKISGRVNE